MPSVITIDDSAENTIVDSLTTVTDVANLSTITLTNPAWTGNIFTTTSTQGGGPTVVPIPFVGGAYIGLPGIGAEIGADASLFSVFALAGLPVVSLLSDGEPQIESENEQQEQPSDKPSQGQSSQTEPPQSSQITFSAPSTYTTASSECSSSSSCETYDYNPTTTPNPLDVTM